MTSREPREGTYARKIMEYVRGHPDGASDADLASALDIRHQQVNQRCRDLASQGYLERAQGGRTILNRLTLDRPVSNHEAIAGSPRPQTNEWEGEVQSTVVAFLIQTDWSIRRVADTASRETGRDIEAERAGVKLWTTVKGYPTGTQRTNPSTQARHWFTGALFDVILWRGEDADVRIAVALPKRSTYLNLAARTKWFQRAANFSFLWVEGSVVEEDSPGPPPLAVGRASSA